MVHVGTVDGKRASSRSCRSSSDQRGGGCLVSMVVGAGAGADAANTSDELLATGVNVSAVGVFGAGVIMYSPCIAVVASSKGAVVLLLGIDGVDSKKGGFARVLWAVCGKESCFGKTWSYSSNVGSQTSSSLVVSNRLHLSSRLLVGERNPNDDGVDLIRLMVIPNAARI